MDEYMIVDIFSELLISPQVLNRWEREGKVKLSQNKKKINGTWYRVFTQNDFDILKEYKTSTE